ncbi:tRNA (cytidine(34)-2'-O)-methyltransferase [Stakelama sp. CBK3Z-3]|uniref:tRNA (cytidine(34)-2'-O)-methyltransferase n=1 Tax=Stakelama flava TaxID=2860338 RepID=A0ABS6XI13_9SPHN|nr:tRNA (cytidine(34)-2'-O)-methyltransferase [Stakelama flava]MBW4329817.1 tRNA (cytidine(34)-2'-O)-methyltransferase [Stakelama flava]
MRIALFEPDIAGNVGTIIRLSACFEIALDLIEPMGFAYSDRALARAGMDYVDAARVSRHADWAAFRAATAGQRLVLFTTGATTPLARARFEPDDILLFGSESVGVPDHVRDTADLRVRIPIASSMRSLNVAIATGIGLAEALRQTGGWPA